MNAPDTAALFPQIQKRFGWTRQNTIDHPDTSIDPNPPQDCALVYSPPSNPNGLLFGIQGQPGKYCGWLSAFKLPWYPTTGHAQLEFDLTIDPNALTVAQALEFDFLVSRNGFNYLFGFEVLIQDGNQLQISNPAAGWQAKFPGPASLTPLKPTHFRLSYKWDENAHPFSFMGVNIDGVDYPIPLGQNPQTASNPKWSDVFIIQVQLDTPPSAGSYWLILDNVDLRIW